MTIRSEVRARRRVQRIPPLSALLLALLVGAESAASEGACGRFEEGSSDRSAFLDSVDSLVLGNRLPLARERLQSVMDSLGPGCAWKDTLAQRGMLLDLLMGGHAPGPAPRWMFVGSTGTSLDWTRSDWHRTGSAFEEILASQQRRSLGWSTASTQEGRSDATDLRLNATVVGFRPGTVSQQHSLGVFGSFPLATSPQVPSLWLAPSIQFGHGRKRWEIWGAGTASVGFRGDSIQGFQPSMAAGWSRMDARGKWTVSLTGTRSIDFLSGTSENSLGSLVERTWIRPAWSVRARVSGDLAMEEQSWERRLPTKTASCEGIVAGQTASTSGLVCHPPGDDDSVVSIHPFKGISGLPFQTTADLVTHPARRMASLGAWLELRRTWLSDRLAVRILSRSAWEPSLEQARWHNGTLGTTMGDTLILIRDPRNGREFLWEQDLDGRYLALERHSRVESGLRFDLRLGLEATVFRKTKVVLGGYRYQYLSSLPSDVGGVDWEILGISLGCVRSW